MRFLPLDRVRLTDGPFAQAVQTDLAYALALDADRLLAPFRAEAGLPPVAERYGNWEDSGLDGHIAGHYLSALAFLWAATGDAEARRRLISAVDEFAACQEATGDSGYVGGVPGGRALFEAIGERGLPAVAELASSDHWVPWYNLHKTFQGLIDAHVVAGIRPALEIVTRLADWWVAVAARIDDTTFEAMLDTEFGGMNDAFAQLHALTGRDAYAEQARRFSHRAILDPLQRGDDALTGLHANTQIPKAVGYAATAIATGDDDFRAAADVFWRTVTTRRSVAIGGNSVREHFHSPDDFSPMIDDREGPEFCNTYNMLKLTRALAEHGLRPEQLDFAERALVNHVLGSQHPERGGFVYFTSMRPRHYRVYSQPQECFWCCVGTGLEAQARYGEWVFGIEADALAVNLYLSAEATVPEFGTRIAVDADLPHRDAVTVTVMPDLPRAFALRLRVPTWAGALVDLRVGGEPVDARAVDGAVIIEREWAAGDVVTLRLPVRPRIERMPDGSPWQAYLAGPAVLAARAGTRHLDGLVADDSRMGHVARGPLLPFGDLPIVTTDAGAVARTGDGFALRAVDGVGDAIGDARTPGVRADHKPAPTEIVLEPFAGIHDERYIVYWPAVDSPDGVAERRAALTAQDRGLALDAATVDAVAFGEQQPESDHAFRGTATQVVVDAGIRLRTTSDRLSVRLAAGGGRVLRLHCRGTDRATAMSVSLAGVVLGTVRLDAGEPALELDFDVHALLSTQEPGAPAELVIAAADGLDSPAIGSARVLR